MSILLLTVIFAGIEFDRMLMSYTSLANAARVGARYAIVHGSSRTGTGDPASGATDASKVTTAVNNFAVLGFLNTSDLTVTVAYPGSTSKTDPGNSPGSTVVVTVTYPYVPLGFLPISTTLRASTRGVIVF